MKLLRWIPIVIALALAACAISPDDFKTPEAYREALAERQDRLERAGRFAEVARLIAVNQVEIWKASGVGDLIQWDESRLLKASAFCATATALTTIINPEMTELTDEGAKWCAEILMILATDTVPVPVPKPQT